MTFGPKKEPVAISATQGKAFIRKGDAFAAICAANLLITRVERKLEESGVPIKLKDSQIKKLRAGVYVRYALKVEEIKGLLDVSDRWLDDFIATMPPDGIYIEVGDRRTKNKGRPPKLSTAEAVAIVERAMAGLPYELTGPQVAKLLRESLSQEMSASKARVILNRIRKNSGRN